MSLRPSQPIHNLPPAGYSLVNLDLPVDRRRWNSAVPSQRRAIREPVTGEITYYVAVTRPTLDDLIATITLQRKGTLLT